MSHNYSWNLPRQPAVAGLFYPQNRVELKGLLKHLLAGPEPSQTPPKGLIVPHAGYVYSAKIAAAAFAKLKGAPIKNVILIGPSHYAYLPGSATSAVPWITPLGEVKIRAFPGLPINEEAFEKEHSLEVQLPFLQTLLPDATIQPVLVGLEEPERLATLLLAAMDDSLIVASSDLSHYRPSEQARLVDRQTIETILDLAPEGPLDACGELGIRALLRIAREKNWKPSLVMAANSGDITGDKARVVGYASVEFN